MYRTISKDKLVQSVPGPLASTDIVSPDELTIDIPEFA